MWLQVRDYNNGGWMSIEFTRNSQDFLMARIENPIYKHFISLKGHRRDELRTLLVTGWELNQLVRAVDKYNQNHVIERNMEFCSAGITISKETINKILDHNKTDKYAIPNKESCQE